MCPTSSLPPGDVKEFFLSLFLFQTCRDYDLSNRLQWIGKLSLILYYHLRHGAWWRRRHLGNQTLFLSDADSKMRKAFPILMMNQSCFTFCQKAFRSNDHFSNKKTFGQTNFRSKDHFFEKAFGQMNFRSNILSVKWPIFKKAFGQLNFRANVISVIWLVFQIGFSVKCPFSKYFRSNDLLTNFIFGQMFSVKWTFGQMALG
jgi:hypothetical protein